MRAVVRLVTLAIALVLTGCGAPETEPPGAAPTSVFAAPTTPVASPTSSDSGSSRPTSPTPTPSPTKVPDTLAFTSMTVDGQPFDGATLAGKPVLFWFWAPWCPTCRGQADEVQAIARDYNGRVAVIGVGSLSQDTAAIEQFAADASGPTHLSDESGAVFRHFGVVQQSSFVLLDAAGEKTWSVGYGGSDALADQVAAVAG